MWFIFPYACLWVCIVSSCFTAKKKPLFWEQNHEINLNRRLASIVSTIEFFTTGHTVYSSLNAGIMAEMFYAFPYCLHTNSEFSLMKAAHFTAPPAEFCNNSQPTNWRSTTDVVKFLTYYTNQAILAFAVTKVKFSDIFPSLRHNFTNSSVAP